MYKLGASDKKLVTRWSKRTRILSSFVAGAGLLALTVSMIHPSNSYATVPGVNAMVSPEGANASVSGDGRYVAFTSASSSLVSGDTNSSTDVFVRDTQNNTTTRVSVATSGTEGDSVSFHPSISYDGRFVVFGSYSSNLVSGDTNGVPDVFERDLVNNTTTLVSSSSSGTIGNNTSQHPVVSADGRFVAFTSGASNLVSNTWQYAIEAFVKDMTTGTTKAVSVDSSGNLGNGNAFNVSMSCDGGVIAFDSKATNFISGDPYAGNSSHVNNHTDLYVSVQGVGGAQISSPSLAGGGNNDSTQPRVSCDGNKIALEGPGNLASSSYYGVLEYDRLGGGFTKVSLPDNDADGDYEDLGIGGISGDGRYVAFESTDTDFGGSLNRKNIYIRDLRNQTTQRISSASGGAEGNNWSYGSAISADGSYVSYESSASNLVSGDTNGLPDLFISETGF